MSKIFINPLNNYGYGDEHKYIKDNYHYYIPLMDVLTVAHFMIKSKD